MTSERGRRDENDVDIVNERNDRLAFLMVVTLALALAVPFACSRYPIGQDMPAHVETAIQLRALLFGDTDSTVAHGYFIRGFLWPNAWPTYLMALLLSVTDGLSAGKIVTAVSVVSWPLALALLFHRLRRGVLGAVFALPTAFDLSLSYGFLHFLAGKPLFVLCLVASIDLARRFSATRVLWLLTCSCALFCTHLMLFAVAIPLCAVTILIVGVPRGMRMGALFTLAASTVPAWFWWLFRRPQDTPGGEWGFRAPATTLVESWSFLGDLDPGVLDGVPWIVSACGFVLCLLLGGPRTFRDERGHHARAEATALGLLALGLLAFCLLGPVRTPHVSIVAERFWSVAVSMLAGLAPWERVRSRVLGVAAVFGVATCTLLVSNTTVRWRAFSAEEMGAFETLVAQVPRGSRVATSFVNPFSPHGRHNAGWHWPKLVAERDAITDDSFAWRSTCVVGLRPTARPLRHPRLQDADLARFDFLLVRGRTDAADRVLRNLALDLVAETGAWRLFRVLRNDLSRVLP